MDPSLASFFFLQPATLAAGALGARRVKSPASREGQARAHGRAAVSRVQLEVTFAGLEHLP